MDRSYWEKKNQESSSLVPSAPVVVEQQTPSQVVSNGDVYSNVQYQVNSQATEVKGSMLQNPFFF